MLTLEQQAVLSELGTWEAPHVPSWTRGRLISTLADALLALKEARDYLQETETFEIAYEDTGEKEVWCGECGELKHDGDWHAVDCKHQALLRKLAKVLGEGEKVDR